MEIFTRTRLFVLLGLLLAALVALNAPVPVAQAQLFSISEQQEIQVGREVERQLAQKPGFVNDPQALQYVRSVGLSLAKVSERPTLPWTYHILNDNTVNALAAPGGYIFVTRGLLPFLQSRDELGFVLGHETTHIAHRHAVDLVQKDMEIQFGAILLTQLVFGGNLTAYQLTQLGRALIDARYSRDKEFEADHFGVIFANKAGYDPRASVTFLERLQTLEQRKQSALGGAFASHPPTPDRIKAVRAELQQMGYQVPGGAVQTATTPAVPATPPPAASSTRSAAPTRPGPPASFNWDNR